MKSISYSNKASQEHVIWFWKRNHCACECMFATRCVTCAYGGLQTAIKKKFTAPVHCHNAITVMTDLTRSLISQALLMLNWLVRSVITVTPLRQNHGRSRYDSPGSKEMSLRIRCTQAANACKERKLRLSGSTGDRNVACALYRYGNTVITDLTKHLVWLERVKRSR